MKSMVPFFVALVAAVALAYGVLGKLDLLDVASTSGKLIQTAIGAVVFIGTYFGVWRFMSD